MHRCSMDTGSGLWYCRRECAVCEGLRAGTSRCSSGRRCRLASSGWLQWLLGGYGTCWATQEQNCVRVHQRALPHTTAHNRLARLAGWLSVCSLALANSRLPMRGGGRDKKGLVALRRTAI